MGDLDLAVKTDTRGFDWWHCQCHALHRQMQHEQFVRLEWVGSCFCEKLEKIKWHVFTAFGQLTYLTVINADALTRPNELRIVHSYRPASWLEIFLMNRLPLGAKRCLADGTIVFPSFRHFTSGDGLPSPWHGNSIVVPSCASMSNGSDMNRGLNDCFSPRHTKFPEMKTRIWSSCWSWGGRDHLLTRIRTLNWNSGICFHIIGNVDRNSDFRLKFTVHTDVTLGVGFACHHQFYMVFDRSQFINTLMFTDNVRCNILNAQRFDRNSFIVVCIRRIEFIQCQILVHFTHEHCATLFLHQFHHVRLLVWKTTEQKTWKIRSIETELSLKFYHHISDLLDSILRRLGLEMQWASHIPHASAHFYGPIGPPDFAWRSHNSRCSCRRANAVAYAIHRKRSTGFAQYYCNEVLCAVNLNWEIIKIRIRVLCLSKRNIRSTTQLAHSNCLQ